MILRSRKTALRHIQANKGRGCGEGVLFSPNPVVATCCLYDVTISLCPFSCGSDHIYSTHFFLAASSWLPISPRLLSHTTNKISVMWLGVYKRSFLCYTWHTIINFLIPLTAFYYRLLACFQWEGQEVLSVLCNFCCSHVLPFIIAHQLFSNGKGKV